MKRLQEKNNNMKNGDVTGYTDHVINWSVIQSYLTIYLLVKTYVFSLQFSLYFSRVIRVGLILKLFINMTETEDKIL